MNLNINEWILELGQELKGDILPWWTSRKDPAGGWPGMLDRKGQAHPSPKGVVMHARFLWTYATAARVLGEARWTTEAGHALAYLEGPLLDKVHGGYHWMVDASGQPTVSQKVIYGQAFALYGLSAWLRLSGEDRVRTQALGLFDLMEAHARDPEFGGYYEAVRADWSQVVPNALGAEDEVCEKSMNTNLHVLEAYTNLYLATSEPRVAQAVKDLVRVHLDKIRTSPAHFGLYFDRSWNCSGHIRSFGHDIEGSWLIHEAAEAVWGHHVPVDITEAVLVMAKKTRELLDEYGPGLINEEHHGTLDHTRIWWVQAEAMVGMLNAWQLTKDEEWLHRGWQVWCWIRDHLVDRQEGEWFWGLVDGKPLADKAKGGLWKTPYHNGRSCLEALQRLGVTF